MLIGGARTQTRCDLARTSSDCRIIRRTRRRRRLEKRLNPRATLNSTSECAHPSEPYLCGGKCEVLFYFALVYARARTRAHKLTFNFKYHARAWRTAVTSRTPVCVRVRSRSAANCPSPRTAGLPPYNAHSLCSRHADLPGVFVCVCVQARTRFSDRRSAVARILHTGRAYGAHAGEYNST